jgi:hypothetical protein
MVVLKFLYRILLEHFSPTVTGKPDKSATFVAAYRYSFSPDERGSLIII